MHPQSISDAVANAVQATDEWDIKAERIHGTAARHDHTGMPIDAIVAITELNLSFGTIFRLTLFFAIAQAIIGGAVLLILLALGTI